MKRDPARAGRRADTETGLEAARGRVLVDESRELVVVLDEERRVVAASRRAREQLDGVEEGEPLPDRLLAADTKRVPFTVSYDVDGRRETLLYLTEAGQLAAYEELRAGFTAAVSHELRTPLARLLALLETATLPGYDPEQLVEQARGQVEQMGELIDDVLFLSELETGREVVALGHTEAMPILRELAEEHAERAVRAGMRIEVEGDESIELPLRPRMLRVVAENLIQNALRYAGPGATLTLTARREGDLLLLAAADTGSGVADEDLPRLFERFYRADRARASRGTGLGLAIVKHIVTSAGGTVEATGARGAGLTIRCLLPAA
jgi:signal transduction histidine kinase